MPAFQTAAITDEFSTDDLDAALGAMREVGMTGAELRVVFGTQHHGPDRRGADAARQAVEEQGMRVLSIASPLLKCVLPDAPPIDARFQQDVFGSAYTFEDQPRLTRRAFEVAERTGARIIRVFSYWRTVEPDACSTASPSRCAISPTRRRQRGIVIGLENEHACNVGTGAEAARMLAAVDHPALGVIWDPANASILGETPYPDGYAAPAARADRPRPRQGLQRQRPHADLGAARRDGAGLAGADRGARPRRLHTARSASRRIGAGRRRPARGEQHLRPQPAGAGRRLTGRDRGRLRRSATV